MKMSNIIRDSETASKKNYDLIIVGGGIYGAMLSLEASRRNLSSLLIERGDFGEATSFNSLRIVHGGLRYLQHLDFQRFFESVGERRWFLQTFPDLILPLGCVMPLYANGIRRPSLFRFALWVNDFLARRRNQGIRPDRHLPAGKIIDIHQTCEIFPYVDTQGLKGGAVWHDACMPDSQRLLIEILRWACKYGAVALNYLEAVQLLRNGKGVAGVVAVDCEKDESFEYRSQIVVNAGGPWCRNLAKCFDRDQPCLFRGSIAWNVLLNRETFSDYAVAVAPKQPDGQTYFLLPWKGKLLTGTGHAPWFGGEQSPMPTKQQLQSYLADLNLAVPSLAADQNEILHVFAGLLPATDDGSANLARREIVFNHGDHGGPMGLYSISGVKFTTARLVAEKTLKRIFPERNVPDNQIDENFGPLQDYGGRCEICDNEWESSLKNENWREGLRSLIQEESVQHLDDLIFRRTTLWEDPDRAVEIAPLICDIFDWDNSRCREEIARVFKKLETCRGPWQDGKHKC